ncbi:hypothetical protein [Branchiibius sp. NY16-3462-2]|uniref:hypothetical protein n=1 Tax=Branchiibius sp. NY16-3462-2 TaxID=1807500 RepID=UPI0007914F7B|nr:hypothetical protein [Branchiibius sp. NY16-3462-2]KYH45095.1 hypothetical protein AZH51_14515 [Branchiibius sp. NY16-3462-2]
MVRRWVIAVVSIAALFTVAYVATGLITARPAPKPVVTAGPVVVVAVPGLSWTQVSASRTPALWQVLDYGATANQVVHTVGSTACTPSAWLTLGAGHGVDAAGCTAPAPVVTGGTATWPAWSQWHSSDAGIGLLGSTAAQHGKCVEAVGPTAALAAADSTGHVTHYASSIASASFATCAVTLVTATASDLNTIVGKLPATATLIVTGLSDGSTGDAGLRLAYALGTGVPAGVLRSASTKQPALIQTADITATLLTALGEPSLPAAVHGRPLQVVPTPQSAAAAAASNAALARAVLVNHVVLVWFWLAWAVAFVVLLGFVIRARPLWTRPALAYLAAVPIGTFLAGLLPWSRWPAPGVWLVVLSLAWAGLVVAVAYAGPWRRWIGSAWVTVCAVSSVVLALDVMHGSSLQLPAMLGLQPEYGGRYYGMGNAGYAIFATAVLILAGLLGGRLIAVDERRLGAWTIGLLCGAAVLMLAAPMWGADFGGPPPLLIAGGIMVVLALGRSLSWRRLALIVSLAVALAVVAGVLDALRPASSRSYLGRFFAGLFDGSGGIVGEKLGANLKLLVATPASPLIPLGLIFCAYVVWLAGRPSQPGWSWARRLGDAVGLSEPLVVEADTRVGAQEVPFLRETAIGVLVMVAIAMVINDSGVAIPAIAALIAFPFATALATREPL